MPQTLLKLNKPPLWQWYVIGCAGISLGVRQLWCANATWAENGYFEKVYPLFRHIQTLLFGWLPFNLAWVFVSAVTAYLIYIVYKLASGRVSLLNSLFTFVAFCSLLLSSFLWLWGYNYCRVPFEKRLGWQLTPIPLAELQQTLSQLTDTLTVLREHGCCPASLPLAQIDKEEIATLVARALITLHYPVVATAPIRALYPAGFLMRFGATGIYNPFTGECNVDAGMHPLQLPFTMAHEYAHAQGITDEGDCNFVAYVALQLSDNLYLRYVGNLAYWRYVGAAWKRLEPLSYKNYRHTLPPPIVADNDAINENLQHYPDFFPQWQDIVYDQFLKVQGVQQGVESYDKILTLIAAWKIQHRSPN